jgi:uncharacterized protein YoaH (UPF0181 family)
MRPLTAGPDQTLVYETDSEYVTGSVAPERIVAVSVVDLRPEVRFTVRHLRNHDGRSFGRWRVPITGDFHCTVVDPLEVVHARHTAAIRKLRRLLAEGLSAGPGFAWCAGHEEEVRERLRARLVAVPTPVPIPGVRVVLGGLSVKIARTYMEYDEDYTEA